MQTGTDADRLQTIHDLEQAIAAKEAPRQEAIAHRDGAKKHENECRLIVSGIDAKIAAIGKVVNLKSSAVYLNGTKLERGTLKLGHEVLNFTGLMGAVDIPLRTIKHIDLGQSRISSRAGLPILEALAPGQLRQRATLLLTVNEGRSQRLAVIADLEDGPKWSESLDEGMAALDEIASHRADLQKQRSDAMLAHIDAQILLQDAQVQLSRAEAEIAPLRAERANLQQQQRDIDAARTRSVQAEQNAARQREQAARKGGK